MTRPLPGAPAAEAPPAPRRPLVVKKFGGTSVATIERMREVARLSIESQRAGNDVVIVVSAMSGETDRLLALAHQILPFPEGREQDVIAATGEQVACALVAIAIQALGGKACSLLGHQLPLLTDDSFTKARIQSVERSRVWQTLAQGQIPVIAGFQGVDAGQNVTTLGRGGSDTTAVALSAALGADACEIYTDVDGVYTADPHVCPSSRKLSSIPYEEMLEMASLGAKVLQVRSVEIAMKYKVPLHVRSSFTNAVGTWVKSPERAVEAKALTGIACLRDQVRVELGSVPLRANLVAELTSLLADLNVCADMFGHLGGASEETRADLAFTIPESELCRTRPSLERLVASLGTGEVRVSGRLAKISLIGIGIRSDPRIAAHLCRSLVRQGIAITGLLVSEIRITCLVDDAASDQTVRTLHDAFGLSQDSP